MEIKKCVRCGVFFTSEIDVCQNCEKKDNADVNKLKNFIGNGLENGTTKSDIAYSTGITLKNLNRFLNDSEFKGLKISDNNVELKKVSEDVVANT